MSKPLVLSLPICLVCLASAQAQSPEQAAKKQTILYVQSLQTPSVGYRGELSDPATQPTLRATSSAIQALKYLGGNLPNKSEVAKFVASCFHKASGGFADTPGGKSDVASTAVGLIVVGKLEMPAEPYHAACIQYLAENVKTFDDIRIAMAGLESTNTPSPRRAAWTAEVMKLPLPAFTEDQDGRARVVGSQVVTLLRLGQKPKDVEAVLKDLRAGQRGSGGYGKEGSAKADLESCYRVMRAFMMLKAKPANVGGLRNFIHKCRNEDNGYGVIPGQPSSISGTYYAAFISHWLDEMK